MHGYAVDQVPGLRDHRGGVARRRAGRRGRGSGGRRALHLRRASRRGRTAWWCAPPRPSTPPRCWRQWTAARACWWRSRCAPPWPRPTGSWRPRSRGARIAYAENLVHAPIVRLALAPHRPARPASTSWRCGRSSPAPPGATSSPTAGAAGCSSTSGSTRSPSLCCWPLPPGPWRCGPTLDGADDHPVDEHAEVLLRFDTDLLARVTVSWRGDDTPTWDAQASSPHGVVYLELLPRIAARAQRRGGHPARHPRRVSLDSSRSWATSPQMESFALDLQRRASASARRRRSVAACSTSSARPTPQRATGGDVDARSPSRGRATAHRSSSGGDSVTGPHARSPPPTWTGSGTLPPGSCGTHPGPSTR